MSHPLLQLDDFCVAYRTVEAVHNVRLQVNEGEIVTVIGPNGAGKTTLLCAAMGLLPSTGQLAERRAHRAPRRGDHGGARRGPGARAARAVRRDVGRRQPAARRLLPVAQGQARPARAHGRNLPDLSAPEGAPPADGLHALGRRTPDAGHRPRAHGAPAPADARRTFAGPGTAGGARGAARGVATAHARRVGAAGGTERPRRAAGGRPRLCAGDGRRGARRQGTRPAARPADHRYVPGHRQEGFPRFSPSPSGGGPGWGARRR
jgi:energy-coupling factor transporter ATP-binding protein EcfA2